MRSGRGLILRIRLAKAAYPTHSGLTLLNCRKAAIRGAAIVATAVNRAPRIVLGFGWSIEHSRRSDDTEYKQDKFHESPTQSGIADAQQ